MVTLAGAPASSGKAVMVSSCGPGWPGAAMDAAQLTAGTAGLGTTGLRPASVSLPRSRLRTTLSTSVVCGPP
jgi:hypothetical protein